MAEEHGQSEHERISILEEQMALVLPQLEALMVADQKILGSLADIQAQIGAPALFADDDPCECKVKLNETKPIAVDNPNIQTFKPNYITAPACDPQFCEKEVSYQWSMTVISQTAPLTLSDSDKEVSKVTGLGEFKLCLKVSVKCRRRVGQSGLFVVTRCEDEGCLEFQSTGN